MKRIGVMTSGGDSPGMNAAIRAVVRACAYYKVDCYGIRLGYQGLIEGDLTKMGARSVSHIINRGGTILKTARSQEFRTPEGRAKAFKTCQTFGLEGLIVIGGDGSFTGGSIFSEEYGLPVVGVPGTIDNDIFGTDYTIGYDTALNTVVDAIDKIRDTATSHNRLFFVEVMGRDAGFIALNSGIGAGAQEILIPEEKSSMEDLYNSLQISHDKGKTSSIVVVSEGDELGNVFEIANQVKEKFDSYDIRVTVLGHLQRGGNPSCFDRVLASKLGVYAVEYLLKGENKVMVGIKNNQVTTVPLEDAISKHNEVDKELVKLIKILKT